MSRLAGGCLCGAVRYAVDDAFEYALICHCSQCRRATGAASKPFGGIPRHRLELTRGADRVMRFGDGPDHDIRCGTCGSLLWSVVRGEGWAHVTYGTLDTAPSLAPQAHIFATSRAAWDHILDDLPQHAEFG